jgi:TRAP-type mannitol/chloroaromatic compound transport system permease small subunit
MAIITGYNYASNSLYINESSPNPGGLPALYIIKYCIVIGFGMLFMQGVVLIYENIKTIIK